MREVEGLRGVRGIAAGRHLNLAVKCDGSVWVWGSQGIGGCWRVVGLSEVVEVAVGELHALALRRDGSVWAWGNNSDGQLGDNSRRARVRPICVEGL